MKLNKQGGIVLSVCMIATVVWVFTAPQVRTLSIGTRYCNEVEIADPNTTCGPDVRGMGIRFLIGAVASFSLAFATTAIVGGKDS